MILKHRRLSGPVLAVFIAALCLLPLSSAAADTFLPTRHDDPTPGRCKANDCSLREAILAANRRGGPDAVDLLGGPDPYELTLPGIAEQEGLTGDLDVTGRLTLEALGPGRATIDANGIDRVLDVFEPTTIRRLALTGGDVSVEPAGNGGGVEASAPTRIVSSTITQNVGAGAELHVGGTVLRSAVSDNLGGGVLGLDGRLVLRRSTVEGNRGGIPGTPSGAGVFATRATIDRSRIIGNVAQAACGGALIAGDSPTVVTDSVFDENIADDGNGGALCVKGTADTRVEIARSRFDRNTADDGGALLLGAVDGSLSDLTVSGNHANGNGGGLRLDDSTVTLTGSTLDHNGAGGSGGGIVLFGPATLDLVNSTVAENDAVADGGGIDAADLSSHARLRFSTIASNLADADAIGGGSGGGISGQNTAYDLVHGTLLALNGVVAPGPIFVPNECDTHVASTGRNLLGVSAGCDGFTGPGDLLDVDPVLGALGAHGGPTETIPLLAGSPAIDAGGSSGPSTDQRGVLRPQGPRYDIGAFERRR